MSVGPEQAARESTSSPGPASRSNLIRARPRVTWLAVVLLSLGFAAVGALIAVADGLVLSGDAIEAGDTSPITIRIPPFAGAQVGETSLAFGGVLLERNEVASPLSAEAAAGFLTTRPQGLSGWATLAAGFFILCFFFSSSLRSAHRGKLVRHQFVLLALLLLAMALVKVATLLTSVSILAVPVATFALLARGAVDRASATAVGLFSAVAVGALVPFDPGVMTVLVCQAVSPALLLGEATMSRRRMLLASIAGGAAAVAAYFAYALLYWGSVPATSFASIYESGAFAALVGGVASGAIAIALLPPFQVLVGEVTANRLVALEDFSNPLLKQIAERSPGTWQHSLAMANMAETAANAVGANGRLVRTGAYYHDLGKSLQPKYFIENLTHGESSPHDSLAPETSADVIFAHVTEGVRVGRKHRLPERIIDFMHMHHGDGRLEYFWSKCQELGNPAGLAESAFRYPGLRPQSVETAVLAIVDAVEAASRTLRSADDKRTRKLVQRIVYGKLHLGQLDESGLTMSDLRKISESLVATIKAAHHGRIEYPWQHEEALADAADNETRSLRPAAAASEIVDTGRIAGDVVLDSTDAPRLGWRAADSRVRPASASRAPVPDEIADAPAPEEPSDSGSEIKSAAKAAEETAPMRPEALAVSTESSAESSASRRLPEAQIVETDADPAGSSPTPLRAPPAESIPVGDSSIIMERVIETTSGAAPAPRLEQAPEQAPEQDDATDVDDRTQPRAPAPGLKPRNSSNTGRLAEWEEALEKALPTVGKSRAGRDTAALIKAGGTESVLEAPDGELLSDADLATSLSPGTLVVGPPPETHPRAVTPPKRTKIGLGDPTLEVRLPVPVESVRPSKRRTTEREVKLPPEAFPDDTEPSAIAVLKKATKREKS